MTLEGPLSLVAHLAGAAIAPTGAAGVVVVRDGLARPVAHTGALAVRLDDAQHRRGDGPAPAALRDGRQVAVDTATDRRWPGFAAEARAAGVRGVLATPLYTGGAAVAVLTVYGPVPFTAEAAAAVRRIADRAATLLGPRIPRQTGEAAPVDDRRLLPILHAYADAAALLTGAGAGTGGAAAGAKVAARTELYRYLIEVGWSPPSGVAARLPVDDLVSRLGEGATQIP